MILTKTPFRISFFGGGTDIEDYFKTHGGSVLSTTIDKYVYVTVRHLPKFFDYNTEIKYSKIERVKSPEEIEHPMIRNAIEMMDMRDIYLSYDADLPNKSGLGTSSTFAVGLINAFAHLKGKHPTKKELAEKAIYLERKLCNEAGGWQDQIAAAHGGFNRIDFNKDGFKVRPIRITKARKKELFGKFLLFFTGFTRFSGDIQKGFNPEAENQEAILSKMVELVNEAQKILENPRRDLDDFGRLLNKTWELKKQTNKKISREAIDELYDIGIKNGALGGKLLGAGGGGFMLFYVPNERQEDVRKAFKSLMEVPFTFEEKGADIIYSRPEAIKL